MSFRVPQHIYHRSLHGEVIVLDSKTNAYLGLNSTASVVWDVLIANGSEEDAVAALVSQYDIDADSARDDVAALVRQFLERSILERAEP